MADFPPIPEQMRPRIDAYWASFLGCQPAVLYPTQPATLWRENSPGLLGLQTARNWLLTLHPGVMKETATDLLKTMLSPLDQRVLQQQLRLHDFADIYGPAYVLYCPQVKMRPRSSLAIHLLDEADQACVQLFQQGIGAAVWQLGQPQLWPRICGIFQEGRLVAAGAVRCWGNQIGEIFVDTLPYYRNRGYAKALVRDLTAWVLRETPWLPQYDAEIHNLPSLRVAHAVGYRYYGMLLLGSLSAQPLEQVK